MKQTNIVAFTSTPRPKGNSAILAEEIIKGAALRILQDASFAIGIELAGWVHASCLKAGEVLDNAVALHRKNARPKTYQAEIMLTAVK